MKRRRNVEFKRSKDSGHLRDTNLGREETRSLGKEPGHGKVAVCQTDFRRNVLKSMAKHDRRVTNVGSWTWDGEV